MSDHKACPFGGRDVIVPGPETESGSHVCVRHRADHTVSIGEMRPVRDGHPVHNEIVQLSGDGPAFDVETLYDPYEAEAEADGSAESKGPAMVASDAYRRGWDAVFGKRPIGQA